MTLLLIRRWGWRWSFVTVGTVGLVWAAAWYAWYRDRPSEHVPAESEELRGFSRMRRAHLRVIRSRRGATLLTSRNLYTICVMYFAFGYGLVLLLHVAADVSDSGAALLASCRWRSLRRCHSCSPVSRMSSAAGRRIGSRHGEACESARCGLGCCAFATCAAFLIGSTFAAHPVAERVLLAFALASADLALAACWAVCLDVGADARRGRHRLHEHVRESRRSGRPDRGRCRGRPLAFVVDAVLHHGGGVTRSARSRGWLSIRGSKW